MAKKTYRAIGRVQGVTEQPLGHGETVQLEHDHEHTVALVAAGALKLASAEVTDDEHAGHLGYTTKDNEKGGTLADAVKEQKEPKAPKEPKPPKTSKPKGKTANKGKK